MKSIVSQLRLRQPPVRSLSALASAGSNLLSVNLGFGRLKRKACPPRLGPAAKYSKSSKVSVCCKVYLLSPGFVWLQSMVRQPRFLQVSVCCKLWSENLGFGRQQSILCQSLVGPAANFGYSTESSASYENCAFNLHLDLWCFAH